MDDRYPSEYSRSMATPASFWLEAAGALDWKKAPASAHSDAGWFADGTLSICYNALDRHVAAGQGDRAALVYDSPVTGRQRRYSYREARDIVARTAGMLSDAGIVTGDRVLIYMPMVPDAAFAMLACARIGAIHSVVFGGFAPAELAKRIDDAEPKVILAASCGIEPSRIVAYKPMLDDALAIAGHGPRTCIVLQRMELACTLVEGRDRDWGEAYAAATPVGCVPVPATHPLYILYTSGTTGTPKGVVRDTGGYAVALRWSMSAIYGLEPGEVMWTASDVGWVVGHSYIVYGPLLHGCTTVLYEGKPVGTPNPGAFWRVIREHGVDVFFTAPTAIRAIRREDPDAALLAEGTAQLRAVFLAGERADPNTLVWLSDLLRIPIIDHWWQTETGWPAIATCLGLGSTDVRFGSAGRPVPGFRFAALDDRHQPVSPSEVGEIALQLPLPPGCLPTLWRDHGGFAAAYLERHPGYYSAGDAGMIDEEGFLHIMSRVDDIINVAGHRLSTAGIEQIVAAHPAVAECAAVGGADALKGMVPVVVVVRKVNADITDKRLAVEVVERVRTELGPVAALKRVAVATMLPKTRSGKILRAVIKSIADGEPPKVPPTIETMEAIDAIRSALAGPVCLAGMTPQELVKTQGAVSDRKPEPDEGISGRLAL